MKLIKRTSNWMPAVPFFFDDFMGRDLADWFDSNFSNGNSLPAVNVKENDEEFELELAVPGMSKNDFKIEFENDVLTVSAEKEVKSEDGKKNGNFYRKEFGYTNFQRSFRLPEDTVNSDAIKASYVDGILKIEIPKREEVKPKPARLIDVK